MVQGYTPSNSTGTSGWPSGNVFPAGSSPFLRSGNQSGCFMPSIKDYDRHPYDERHAHTAAQSNLPRPEGTGGETGGPMLNITGIKRFYYLRNFHDMRCKYDRVLSIIHQQLNREPAVDEFFIVMSKDRRRIRLFSFDRRSFSLYEKRFNAGYKFMHVCRQGDEPLYNIRWKDVVLLLQNPVVNTLNVR